MTSFTRFLFPLLLLCGTHCNSRPICFERPEASHCEKLFAEEMTTVSKAQGGTFFLIIYETVGKGMVVINQTSPSQYYILAKLVQPGIASLDLTLEPGKDGVHYQATVTSLDLMPFQRGEAQIVLTTSDGMITKSATLN